MALARSCRRGLMIDAGQPRNNAAADVRNVMARDGTPPTELLAAGRDEVTGRGGSVIRDAVTAVTRTAPGRFRGRSPMACRPPPGGSSACAGR